jgi:hypothetical protein
LAAQQGWALQQFDVDTAYLYATLEEEIFMDVPDGLLELWGDRIDERERELLREGKAALRLNKALYGLKQSGRRWYETISDYMERELGVKATETEPCVFVGDGIIVVLYVDDGLIATISEEAADAFLNGLEHEFKIKRLGFPRHFVGWTVTRTSDGGIGISQRGYVEALGEQYAADMRPKATPMAYGADLPDDGPEGDSGKFRAIIGSLMFAAVGTRPDIAAATSMLSRNMLAPTKAHVAAARNVVSYVSSTADLGLVYKAEGELRLEVFCDASFAPEEHQRRSRSGWMVAINGVPVSWRSTLQPIVARSTAESEYVAMAEAAGEAMYVRQLLRELGHDVVGPIVIYEDNQTAKRMAEEIATKRSRHIDVRYHYVRELVRRGAVVIKDCRSDDMLADLLTKPRVSPRCVSTCCATASCQRGSVEIHGAWPVHRRQHGVSIP